MIIEAEKLLGRFKNDLTIMKELYLEEVKEVMNERDLKELIYILGDYIAFAKAKGTGNA